MAIAAPGVGSNLDVNGIVTQLMNIEKQPLTQLAVKEASFQSKLSAYGSLKSALSSLSSALSSLASASTFSAVGAKSSDTSILTASTLRNATPGSYVVNVGQLAQAQSIVSAAQSSTSSAIGAATPSTLTIDFGTVTGGTLTNGVYSGATFTPDSTQGTKTITIPSTNNSLQGIRDAINGANAGVKASIVNDGGTTPYRLVLQSSATGASSNMRISVSGDATVASLLSYDPASTQNLTQTSAGQDATLTINGVSVSSHTNSVAGAIEGVTLSLVKAGSATLNVDRDPSKVQTAVQSLVKAYNDFKTTKDSLSAFDPATKTGGPLIGDTALRSVESQLRQALTGNITGTSSSGFSVLSQVGLSFQKDGTLALDSAKLSAALAQDSDGVAGLFASIGRASDSLVQVNKFGTSTGAGQYALDVTQIATQGTLVGSTAAGLTITTGSNDALSVTLDGVSASITLAAGTYTAAQLASQVESKINGNSAFSSSGHSVKVTEASGVLTITSSAYGSTSALNITGNGASGILGGSPVATTGLDVQGSIGGIAATGKGQTLTAGADSPANGLAIDVTGGATGDRGTVSFSRGYAHRLQSLLDGMVAGNGIIAGRTDGITRSIKDIDDQRVVIQRRLDAVEARYRTQFAALDSLISSMNSTSAFLTQQLASLPGSG